MTWQDQIGFPILSVITYLPLAGVLLILLVGRGRPTVYKTIALISTVAAFVLAVRVAVLLRHERAAACSSSKTSPGSSRSTSTTASASTASRRCCSSSTTLLGFIVIIASWNYVKDREMGFFISLLLLQVGMTGVFLATDLFLFYVFWEAMLVPMYFIIGIWGGPRRIYAAIKFFLFTLVGSLLMLIAIIAVVYYVEGPHRDWAHLQHPGAEPDRSTRTASSSGLSSPSSWRSPSRCRCGPCTPGCRTRTWRRPTAGSVILAGVLLKMGGYGILRFCLPFFPDAAVTFIPYIVGPVGDRHRLRRHGRDGAEGPQEARRLLEREPHGLRDGRHLRVHRARRATPPAWRAPSW